MNEPDFIDLIEKDLSGEITEEESCRLKAYLEENEEARDTHRKMLETCQLLEAVKDLEPPAGIKGRIMDSIDPALYASAARPPPRTSLWDILLGPRLRLAYVFVLGLAIGLVTYSLMPGSGPGGGPESSRYLYGTIAGGEQVELSEVDKTTFAVPGVEGEIALFRADNILVIEPALTSSSETGIVLTFDPEDIRFEGYGTADGLDMRVVARDGSIATSGTGAGKYVLTLLEGATENPTLVVEVLVSGSPAYRHEFRVEDQN